jgi:hypothetical protein
MSFHVTFWDADDQNLSRGSAVVEAVPAVGDSVSIFTDAGVTKGIVKVRHWRVDDEASPPAAHAPYRVEVQVKV